MVSVHYSKLLTTTSEISENTYYYEFDIDSTSDLPSNMIYNGTNIAHGSVAFSINDGKMFKVNSSGEWHNVSNGSTPN